MTAETFKPLPHPLDAYEAGDAGTIRTRATGRVLSQHICNLGYPRVGLHKGLSRASPYSVHRLVALAHVPGDTSLTVNHKDLNKQNNHASNLEWVTLSENHRHLHAHRPELAVARGLRRSKALVAVRLSDGVTERYASGKAAAAALGNPTAAGNISVAAHQQRPAYGRSWTFDTPVDRTLLLPRKGPPRGTIAGAVG